MTQVSFSHVQVAEPSAIAVRLAGEADLGFVRTLSAEEGAYRIFWTLFGTSNHAGSMPHAMSTRGLTILWSSIF